MYLSYIQKWYNLSWSVGPASHDNFQIIRSKKGRRSRAIPKRHSSPFSRRLRSPMQIRPLCVYRAEKYQATEGSVVIKRCRRSAPGLQPALLPWGEGRVYWSASVAPLRPPLLLGSQKNHVIRSGCDVDALFMRQDKAILLSPNNLPVAAGDIFLSFLSQNSSDCNEHFWNIIHLRCSQRHTAREVAEGEPTDAVLSWTFKELVWVRTSIAEGESCLKSLTELL